MAELVTEAMQTREDVLCVAGNLLVTRAEVEAGAWTEDLIRAKVASLASSFKRVLREEIEKRGWEAAEGAYGG